MYFRMLVAVVFDFVTCADLALSYFSIPIPVNDKWHGLNWKILEIKQAQGCGEAITLYNISRHFEFGSVRKPVKILYTCSFPTIVTVLVYYRCNVVTRFIYPVVLQSMEIGFIVTGVFLSYHGSERFWMIEKVVNYLYWDTSFWKAI